MSFGPKLLFCAQLLDCIDPKTYFRIDYVGISKQVQKQAKRQGDPKNGDCVAPKESNSIPYFANHLRNHNLLLGWSIRTLVLVFIIGILNSPRLGG